MTEQDIKHLIEQDPDMMAALRAAKSLALPDCWIAAGFVRNRVWDAMHEQVGEPLADIDVVFFDPTDTSKEREKELNQTLESLYPTGKWSVKNQARMSERNGDAPYTSTSDALAHWTETATASAAALADDGSVILLFPHGSSDLLNGILRCPLEREDRRATYRDRVQSKQWLKRWPKVKMID